MDDREALRLVAEEVLMIQGNPEDAKNLLESPLTDEDIEEIEDIIDELWEAHPERYAK